MGVYTRAPACLVPVEAVSAGPVDAGVAVAFVDLRQARGVMVALGTAAGEASDAVLTGAPVVAGVASTLINVDTAHAPCSQGGDSDTEHSTQGPPLQGPEISPSGPQLPCLLI